MLWLQTVCSSGACTVSVVVPDLCSLFSPKLNLKQGLLSHPEGHMFALIKTMSLMDKDVNVGNSQGGGAVFLYWMQKSSGKMAQHPLFVWEHNSFSISIWPRQVLLITCAPLQLDTFTPAKHNHSPGGHCTAPWSATDQQRGCSDVLLFCYVIVIHFKSKRQNRFCKVEYRSIIEDGNEGSKRRSEVQLKLKCTYITMYRLI